MTNQPSHPRACVNAKRCGNDASPGATWCDPCWQAREGAPDRSWGSPAESDARVTELVELMLALRYGVGREVTPIAWRGKHGISATQQAKEVAAARYQIRKSVSDEDVMGRFEAELDRVIADALEVSVSAARWDGSPDDRELIPDQGTRVQALKLIKDAVMDYAKLRGLGVTQKLDVSVEAARQDPARLLSDALAFAAESEHHGLLVERGLAEAVRRPEHHAALLAAADGVRAGAGLLTDGSEVDDG